MTNEEIEAALAEFMERRIGEQYREDALAELVPVVRSLVSQAYEEAAEKADALAERQAEDFDGWAVDTREVAARIRALKESLSAETVSS
jgi:hypothetical protein